jgi:uncharacterized protein
MMSIRVEGHLELRASTAAVFAFFSDPRKLLDCLDDPHTLAEVEGDRFSGTITTGVAFIRGTFRFEGRYVAKLPGERIATEIHGTGLANTVDATLTAAFTEGATGTVTTWTADISLQGSALAFGEPLMRSTVEKKASALFEKARGRLESGP